MKDYKFPEMYFYCDDPSIQRQVQRIAKAELDEGRSVIFQGKPYFSYDLLMLAVDDYCASLKASEDNEPPDDQNPKMQQKRSTE